MENGNRHLNKKSSQSLIQIDRHIREGRSFADIAAEHSIPDVVADDRVRDVEAIEGFI